jgi:ATP-dependent helicase/nuclease subunit B
MSRSYASGRFEVVVSPAAADRLAAAVAFLRAFPANTEVLLIGATREAADDLVRGLARDGTATFGLHRFTLLQLASRLAAPRLTRAGLAPLTPLGAISLAARIGFDGVRDGRVTYFAPVARCPGFARALAATLAELRLGGVRPDSLRGLSPAGDDLAALLSLYEERIGAAALADRALLLELAAAAVSGRAPVPPPMPALLLDVPLRSAAERAFVAALGRAAGDVLATAPSADTETVAALSELGAVRDAAPASGDTPAGLSRLRTYLFSTASPPAGGGDDGVLFFSAPGQGRECIEIARQVLDEARAGVPFDDVAVLLRAADTYSPLLESAFRRAGIPAYFARGTRRPDPAGRAFLALLACLSQDLSARRFAEYLSFAQVPARDSGGAPPAGRQAWVAPAEVGLPAAVEAVAAPEADGSFEERDFMPTPWRWEEYLVEAAVIGGRARWQQRLDGLERELRLRLEELRADDPDSQRIEGIERDLVNVGDLRRFALPVVDFLAECPKQAAWGEWLDLLRRLAPMVLRRPERVLRVLAELQPMAAVGPVSADEVREVLADRLSALELDPPADRYGRVFIAAPDDARGRAFAVVFVPGLAERLFPQRPREDPLLLDAARERLAAALATQGGRIEQERLLLRIATGAARRRVVLSYPRVDVVEARPRVTSFYGLDVVRATRGAIPDFEQFERQAAAAAEARLAWPAPRDPARSIDAIERDLSVLGHLLHEVERGEGKGRARYLLQLNPHLARSLRSRWWRWRRKWTEHDGLLRVSDSTAAALAASRLGARPYSASALQRFAACPYQFVLAAVHGLEPRREAVPLERLDPLTRGRMFHRVQAEALREMRERGMLPLGGDGASAAEAVLDRTLDRVAAQVRDEVAPPIPRVWQDEIGALRADLRSWLRHVVASAGEWEPVHFELAFGLPPDPGRDASSVRAPVSLPGGALLRGSVDLVERSCAGDRLRVTDHKTGADRTADGLVVGGGEVLQPVLYALAVEEALGIPVSESRLFHCTARGGFRERIVPIDERARRLGREVLEAVDRAVAAGNLPPAPRENACRTCDYRVVCGPYEEIRARRKDPAPLADLRELRRRP